MGGIYAAGCLCQDMNISAQPRGFQASIPPTTLADDSLGFSSAHPAGLHYLAERMKLLFASGLYIVVLLWAYTTVVSPNYAYEGMICRWPDALMMVWVIVLTLAPCFFLPYALARPSAVILWWLYLVVYIPSQLIPALTLSMSSDQFLTLQISLLACMALLCWAGSTRPLDTGRFALAGRLFWSGFWLVWIVSVTYIALSGGVGKLMGNLLTFFEGGSEYAIRSEFNRVIAESGRTLSYLIGELGHAFDPFLIAYGLVYRRRWYLVAGVVGQILIFGLTGLKSILLSGLFLALIAALASGYRKSFGSAFAIALTCIVLLCTGVDYATYNIYLSSLFTRRTVLVPGLMTGFYFEHYSQVGPVGFGMHFSHDPSILTPPNEIAAVYFHDPETNANANLWAEGFAELGLPGMLAFTLFTAFLMWLYDSLAAKRDVVLAALLAAMPAVAVSNTSPTTVLVTWGGLMAGVLLYISPRPEPAPAFNLEAEQQDQPVATAGMMA